MLDAQAKRMGASRRPIVLVLLVLLVLGITGCSFEGGTQEDLETLRRDPTPA